MDKLEILNGLMGSKSVLSLEETKNFKTAIDLYSPLGDALSDACEKLKGPTGEGVRTKLFANIKTELNLAAAQSLVSNKKKVHNTLRNTIIPVLEDRLINGKKETHEVDYNSLLEDSEEYTQKTEETSYLINLKVDDKPFNPNLTTANDFLKTTYPELENIYWDIQPVGNLTRHAGWIPESIPTQDQPGPLKALRTLGMMDQDRVRVGSVMLDLSSLGNLTYEQGLACLKYLKDPTIGKETLPPGSKALLDKFRKAYHRKLKVMHDELMQFNKNLESEAAQRNVDKIFKDVARSTLAAALRGKKNRKQVTTPALIRQKGSYQFNEIEMTPEQAKVTSQKMAYEMANTQKNDKEFRIASGQEFRNPDSLPTSKRDPKFTGYKTQETTHTLWAVPKDLRFTVIGSQPLGQGGLKEIYSGFDLRHTKKNSLEFEPKAIIKTRVPEEIENKSERALKIRDITDQILKGTKTVQEVLGDTNIADLGLAGILQDTGRRDEMGGLEATDVRYISNLYDEMIVNNSMTSDQKVAALQQIAKTLKFFHAKNLIHRDIKPKNILMDKDKIAHVSDHDFVTIGKKKAAAGTDGYIDALALNGFATPFQDIYALAYMIISSDMFPVEERRSDEVQKIVDAAWEVLNKNSEIARKIKKHGLIDQIWVDNLLTQYPQFQALIDLLTSK